MVGELDINFGMGGVLSSSSEDGGPASASNDSQRWDVEATLACPPASSEVGTMVAGRFGFSPEVFTGLGGDSPAEVPCST